MVTQIIMIPELQLGIIVLTNQEEGGAFSAIVNQIKDSYLGVTGTDRVTEYAALRKKQLEEDKKLTDSIWREVALTQSSQAATSNRPLASGRNGRAGNTASKEHADEATANFSMYAGTYRDAWLGEVTISMKNGKRWFQSKRSPKLGGELIPYKGNSFIVKWQNRSMNADAFVLFSLDERGVANGIKMKAVSPLTDFSYDFQDLDFHKE